MGLEAEGAEGRQKAGQPMGYIQLGEEEPSCLCCTVGRRP